MRRTVRPVTTGSSNRNASDRSNTSFSSNRLVSERTNSVNLTRSTGSWSLSKKRDGRPRIESATTPHTRKRETVDLTRTRVEESKNWQSESKDAYRLRELKFADKLLELNQEKEKVYMLAFDKYNADKARRKLQRIVGHKFGGSVDVLFEHADQNGDGEIDFEEFSTILKKQRLEQFFPRKEQRDIFKAIDMDHSGTVNMNELLQFLNSESEGEYNRDGAVLPRVVKSHDSPKATPTESEEWRQDGTQLKRMPVGDEDSNVSSASPVKLTTSKAQRTEEQDSVAKMQRTKDRIVEKIVKRRRRDKNEDGHGFDTQYILNAFKQADQDQSGSLSREELKQTFGPKGLDLGVAEEELDQFITAADVDADGSVSYTEFIKALAIHDLEPSYNPVLEARERGLKKMKDRLKQPFKFKKEYDIMYAEAMRKRADSEALNNSAAEMRDKLKASFRSGPEENPRAGLLNPAWCKSTKLLPRIPGPSSDLRPGYDGRAVDSSEGLFDDIHRINDAILRSVQSDKLDKMRHSFDNSRVGIGTGGVDPASALFANSSERFKTTYSQYHGPIVYTPNMPVTRPSSICNSTMDAEKRALRRNARFARSQKTKDIIAEREAQTILMKLMDQDQRERAAAEQAYTYSKKAYFKDLRLNSKAPLEVMAKRPNWPLFAKTYSTSKKTQLREMVNQPDTRDMESVCTKDFSYIEKKPRPVANAANRKAANLLSSVNLTQEGDTISMLSSQENKNLASRMTQTSQELTGGVVPGLHRTTMKGHW